MTDDFSTVMVSFPINLGSRKNRLLLRKVYLFFNFFQHIAMRDFVSDLRNRPLIDLTAIITYLQRS